MLLWRPRRGGRAAECAGLENRSGCKPTVGSNPTPSATLTDDVLASRPRTDGMSRFRSRGARAVFAAAIVALVAMAGAAAPASAHPLGNFTVNRAIRVEIGTGVTITAVLDLAEIPAFEVIRDLDTDGDERLSPSEGDPYAATTCATWGSDLAVSIDGSASALEPLTEPDLALPAGAGGLPTLRLVCRFTVEAGDLGGGETHELSVTDRTDDDRIGWHEVSAGAGDGATIVESAMSPRRARAPSSPRTRSRR